MPPIHMSRRTIILVIIANCLILATEGYAFLKLFKLIDLHQLSNLPVTAGLFIMTSYAAEKPISVIIGGCVTYYRQKK